MNYDEKMARKANYQNTIKDMQHSSNKSANARAIFDRMPYDLPDHRYDNVEDMTEGTENV